MLLKKLNSTGKKSMEIIPKDLQKLSRQWKAKNYSEIVKLVVSSCSAMWCNIFETSCSAFKSAFFPENKAAFSDNFDYRYHQDISQSEKSYIEWWISNRLTNYCWILTWKTKIGKNKWQTRKKWDINIFLLARIMYIESLFIIWSCIL